MSETNMFIAIFFAFALLMIVLFYILMSRRIDEISEKIIKWQSLQADFNQTQNEINIETKNSFDSVDTAAQMRAEKIKILERDAEFLGNQIREIKDSLRKVSAETPSERCDILEKRFSALKKLVEDYTEILLDHAMQ